MNILEVKDLCIQFGGLKAVDNFNMTIKKGQLYGLIGPNGAGKTTVFNMLTGVYEPTSGTIMLDGQDITELSISDRAKAGIGYGFQQPARFKGMKVKKLLNAVMQETLEPIRTRREEFAKDIPAVWEMLYKGSEEAKARAAQTLDAVKKAMKIDYFSGR